MDDFPLGLINESVWGLYHMVTFSDKISPNMSGSSGRRLKDQLYFNYAAKHSPAVAPSCLTYGNRLTEKPNLLIKKQKKTKNGYEERYNILRALEKILKHGAAAATSN